MQYPRSSSGCSSMQGICVRYTGGWTTDKEGSSAKFELISGLTLALQRSFLRKTNEANANHIMLVL